MAKKPSRTYVCTNCGAVHAKWAGQCDACGEWNTLEEMAVEPLAASSAAVRGGKGRRVALQALEGRSNFHHAPKQALQSLIGFWAVALCLPLLCWWGETPA